MTEDMRFIRQLEKQLGKKLGRLDKIDLTSVENGYVLDDSGNVSGLGLCETKLTDLSPLQGLTNLTRLDLSNNRIKKLPPELLELGMEVLWEDGWVEKGLNLYGNPLESPPVEFVRQGMEAVREYFRASGKEETRLLNEVKVLLVGDGGAGKTSLVRRLVDGKFRPAEKQTHGVYIRDWPVRIGGKNVKVHFWDFGGQGLCRRHTSCSFRCAACTFW